MGNQDLVRAFEPIVIFVLLGALYASARRARPSRDGDRITFTYPFAFRAVAWIFAVLVPGGLGAVVWRSPANTPEAARVAFLAIAVFAAIGACLLWEAIRFAATISPDGIDCRSPWRRRRFFWWSEIAEVTWKQTMQWYLVRTKDGRTFRVPALVGGASEFAAQSAAEIARVRAGYGEGRGTKRGGAF